MKSSLGPLLTPRHHSWSPPQAQLSQTPGVYTVHPLPGVISVFLPSPRACEAQLKKPPAQEAPLTLWAGGVCVCVCDLPLHSFPNQILEPSPEAGGGGGLHFGRDRGLCGTGWRMQGVSVKTAE